MTACFVCGTQLADDAKSCSVCGTSLAPVSAAADPPAAVAPAARLESAPAATGRRICPACRTRYDAAYADNFCVCGSELSADSAELEELPLEREAPGAVESIPLERPAAVESGPRLVVYSADHKPIHTLALDRDVTRIGRNDPVRGDFVDLDVGQVVDAATARKVSRKHAVILRSRETQTFTLRPLARNTGTQIGSELAVELQDYPLTDGTRIVLGGAVRLKFHAS